MPQVTCSRDLQAVGKLQLLSLDDSILDGIHAKDLSACTGLRTLECGTSRVGATDESQHIDVAGAAEPAVFPETFPALQHLTQLYLWCHGVTSQFDFQMFTNLTALEELDVLRDAVEVVVCNSLTCLRRLQHLSICSTNPMSLLMLDVR